MNQNALFLCFCLQMLFLLLTEIFSYKYLLERLKALQTYILISQKLMANLVHNHFWLIILYILESVYYGAADYYMEKVVKGNFLKLKTHYLCNGETELVRETNLHKYLNLRMDWLQLWACKWALGDIFRSNIPIPWDGKYTESAMCALRIVLLQFRKKRKVDFSKKGRKIFCTHSLVP